MSPGIYQISEGGDLIQMLEQPYASEDVLQEFLERYPDLLAGDQFPGDEPRRWVLVSREAGLASERDGAARWSVDHVFLDQEAVPTLVEVKRSSDSRIRREVVGQMLDYAANAVVYWPVEDMRQSFEATCSRRGVDPAEAVEELLAGGGDYDRFWQTVRTNLQAGRVRMVFVADVIPAELQRIVEFMNEQMSTAEVLAVELRQYVADNQRTLVPRVIGRTAAAQQQKAVGGGGRQWDEQSFFAQLVEQRGKDEAEVARKILEWCRDRLPRFVWGKGKETASVSPRLGGYLLFVLYSTGLVEVQFQWLSVRPPFDDEARRRELAQRLQEIPGVDLGADPLKRRPSFPLAALVDERSLELFLSAIQWSLDQAAGAPAQPS